MLTLLKKITQTFVNDFLLPSFCLLCKSKTDGPLLCLCCLGNIEVADEGLALPSQRQLLTCEYICGAHLLCKESQNNRSLQSLIASLMTMQLCRSQEPLPCVIVPLAMKGEDLRGIAKKLSGNIGAQYLEIIKLRCLTLTEKGLKRKDEIYMHREALCFEKNICVISFYPLDTSCLKQAEQQLLSQGAGSVRFLALFSLKAPLIER